MPQHREVPRMVLMCHEQDRIDSEGLAAWLASRMNLVAVIKLREPWARTVAKARNEIRRVGLLRFLDVLAFRMYYRFRIARRDAAWVEEELARLHSRYPAETRGVETLVASDPNGKTVAAALRRLQPNLMLARCKRILKPSIYGIPTHGTYVLHPGICPEYRNAHGCFWALVNRDMRRVGMTLLKADAGVDTGPVLMQSSYPFDEINESHTVVQYRVVLENLDAVADALIEAWRDGVRPLPVEQHGSRAWGQPWLSAYLKWRRAARVPT